MEERLTGSFRQRSAKSYQVDWSWWTNVLQATLDRCQRCLLQWVRWVWESVLAVFDSDQSFILQIIGRVRENFLLAVLHADDDSVIVTDGVVILSHCAI